MELAEYPSTNYLNIWLAAGRDATVLILTRQAFRDEDDIPLVRVCDRVATRAVVPCSKVEATVIVIEWGDAMVH